MLVLLEKQKNSYNNDYTYNYAVLEVRDDGPNILYNYRGMNTSEVEFWKLSKQNLKPSSYSFTDCKNASEINYKNKGLGGLDSAGNTIAGKCKLVGTYKLTTLLDDSIYKGLCEYFDELNIQQPEFTTISFDLANSTPQKVSNFDNNTGMDL